MACNVFDASFSEKELEEHLLSNGICEEVAANFKKNLVTGEAFLKLNEGDLRELVELVGVRTKIRDLIRMYSESPKLCIPSSSKTAVTESRSPSNKETATSLNWHLSFIIPESNTFSECVQEATKTGVVTSRARREIVQTLRTLILQHSKYMTSEQYTTISQRLVGKFPKLRDSLGSSGYGSWKQGLRNSFKNFRRKDSKVSSSEPPQKRCRIADSEETPVDDKETPLDDKEYDEAVSELITEWSKGKKNRSYAKVKELMSVTGIKRRSWIKDERPLIEDVLKKFPCLRTTRMIRKEFRTLLGLEDQVSSLKDKWQYWKDKLVKLAHIESPSRPAIKILLNQLVSETEDEKNNSIVIDILQKLLYPRGAGKNWTFIKKIETLDMDVQAEVSKIAQSEPYIVVVGEVGTDQAQFFVCGEKDIICESKTILDSVIDLIAIYYIFDISYPKSLAGIYLFFQQNVFDIKDDQVAPSCLAKIINNILSLA